MDNALDAATIESELMKLVELAVKRDANLQNYRQLNELFNKLTIVETDVLKLILKDCSNKEIADQLKVSIRTVESRRAKLYRKCEAGSIVSLIRKADQFTSLRSVFENGAEPLW